MVLGNFVVLEPNTPKVLQLRGGQRVSREITDPVTKRLKRVTILEFEAIAENGVAVEKVFSVTSEKLAQALWPFVEQALVERRTFIITRRGSDFRTEYEVQALPR